MEAAPATVALARDGQNRSCLMWAVRVAAPALAGRALAAAPGLAMLPDSQGYLPTHAVGAPF